MLDLLSGFDPTRPEWASLLRRLAAFWIDSLLWNAGCGVLIVAVSVPLGILGALVGQRGSGIAGVVIMFLFYGGLTAVLLLMVVYEALMVRYSGGQTLGKKAAGIKVVSADGGAVTTGQAWGRAATRLVTGCACAFVDYLPALFTKERTTLHDILPRTRVVRAR